MRKMFAAMTRNLVSKETALEMEQLIEGHKELGRVKELEEEATRIANEYVRRSSNDCQPLDQKMDDVRQQNAYIKMVSDSLSSMTACMQQTNHVAGSSGCELVAVLNDLKNWNYETEDEKLMEREKHTRVDEIVNRMNETLLSIREMLHDLNGLTDESTEDEDQQQVMNQLNCIREHDCKSMFRRDNNSDTVKNNLHSSWLSLQEKWSQVDSLKGKFTGTRNAEIAVRCLKKIREAETKLREIRSHHHHHHHLRSNDH